ncbi:MAG: glycosyltransferase [Candidatus Bathyarchaeia archaeon]
MSNKKVLFVSGSLGLGHVGRDIEIAIALREIEPKIEIFWLAEEPAKSILVQAGEDMLSEAELLVSGNAKLERAARKYSANLVRITASMLKGWSKNAKLVASVVEKMDFDLVIGDETYELPVEMVKDSNFKLFPFVMIYDFIGVDVSSSNPLDKIYAYAINRMWAKAMVGGRQFAKKSLFLGEVADVPDKRFGFMLPNRRGLALKTVDFVGHVLPFDPDEFKNKSEVRKLLGYGEERLVICSIGGTSAGKDLLDLCVKAYPFMKKAIPDLKLVLVCGPDVSPSSVYVPEGVEVKGFVPELFKHLAAADLAIVTGGGTLTLELTVLQRPFLYFPLQNHFEQEVAVANRCARYRAGVKMNFAQTSPEKLAEIVLQTIDKNVTFASVPVDGAKNVARLISQVLREETCATYL